MHQRQFQHGPQVLAQGINYRLWSCPSSQVVVVVMDQATGIKRSVRLTPPSGGWFAGVDLDGQANDQYQFQLNDRLPDVASRFQPFGVSGPSQVINSSTYRWQHRNSMWRGRLKEFENGNLNWPQPILDAKSDELSARREREEWRIFSKDELLILEFGILSQTAFPLVVNLADSLISTPSPFHDTGSTQSILFSNETRFGGDGLNPYDGPSQRFQFTGTGAILIRLSLNNSVEGVRID
jgi:hypothetical protein